MGVGMIFNFPVALLAGTWIENAKDGVLRHLHAGRSLGNVDCKVSMIPFGDFRYVAPLAGAWIETAVGQGESVTSLIALLAGAWIETRT